MQPKMMFRAIPVFGSLLIVPAAFAPPQHSQSPCVARLSGPLGQISAQDPAFGSWIEDLNEALKALPTQSDRDRLVGIVSTLLMNGGMPEDFDFSVFTGVPQVRESVSSAAFEQFREYTLKTGAATVIGDISMACGGGGNAPDPIRVVDSDSGTGSGSQGGGKDGDQHANTKLDPNAPH